MLINMRMKQRFRRAFAHMCLCWWRGCWVYFLQITYFWTDVLYVFSNILSGDNYCPVCIGRPLVSYYDRGIFLEHVDNWSTRFCLLILHNKQAIMFRVYVYKICIAIMALSETYSSATIQIPVVFTNTHLLSPLILKGLSLDFILIYFRMINVLLASVPMPAACRITFLLMYFCLALSCQM